MITTARRLEGLPTPMWIALVVLGFVLWWPLGFAVLACMMWSGTMRCCDFGFGRWNDRADNVRKPRGWIRQPRSSGNQAFDEYRAETLRRLEEEQRAFQEYLDRLRMAKDRAEFDQFMAERRAGPESGSQM